MLTCTGPRCSGESCREADSIPWCAIQVSLVPSSSVQALVPTGDARAIPVEIAFCGDPGCAAEDNWAAAVSPAAAVLAVAAGGPAVEPPAAAGLEAPRLVSEAGFWVSSASSAAAPLLPEGPIALPTVAEVLVVDAAGAPDTAAAACIP